MSDADNTPATSTPAANLVPVIGGVVAVVSDLDRLLEVWRASLSAATRPAYLADLQLFAAWAGMPTAQTLVAKLLAGGKVAAEAHVLRYLTHLLEQERRAPATVARRRAAIRSVVRIANGLGLVEWTLTAPLPRSARPRAYRDTRGPGLAAVRRMREVAAAQLGVKGFRDVALLGMLYGLGLRRAELCSLEISDYDRGERKLKMVGKGHRDAELVTVPAALADEIAAYLSARGSPTSGPLFANCDRAGQGSGRLTASGLYKFVRKLARRADVRTPVSPHRIRHSAITDALDGTKGDVRRVKRFSRHSKLETVLTYDDARRDDAGEVATMLAASLGKAAPSDVTSNLMSDGDGEREDHSPSENSHENAHSRDLGDRDREGQD